MQPPACALWRASSGVSAAGEAEVRVHGQTRHAAGARGGARRALRDAHTNPSSQCRSSLGALPRRYGHTAVAVEGPEGFFSILVYGGFDEANKLSKKVWLVEI
eukprot:6193941-Pleurochrysis_carterae.AAC.4